MTEPAGSTHQVPPTEVRIDGLAKHYGETTALDSVSFHVGPGQILGLLGPNGAGKTTVVNILSTLLLPDAGSAHVGDHDVVSRPHEVRKLIALTGQFAALDDVLTASENLVLFARLRGLSVKKARSRAQELLERFGLADVGANPVKTFSGGMRRRLDIASSLVVPVPVLFLDEPTTGLDPRSRAELWTSVRELRHEGLTIILTTQYLEEADQLADQIVVIDRGRLVAKGSPAELKERSGGQTCVISPVDAQYLGELARMLVAEDGIVVDDETGTLSMPAGGSGFLARIVGTLDKSSIDIAEVALRQPTLDEAFLKLTGDSS